MPTLELINERFAKFLRTALVQHLRPPIEVTPPIAIQLVKYGQLIEQLGAPSHLTLINLTPLRGTLLVVADADLVSWIVESRFGGDGRFPRASGNREFSAFEQKSTRRIVETLLDQLALAWRPIGSFTPQITRHETNPQFAGIANPGEQIIVSRFDMKVGPGGGKLAICIPYLVLEPIHERLVTGIVKQPVDHDLRWHNSLAVGVGRATMTLNVELTNIELTVRDLLGLQPGSVFEIDRPESVTVEACGLPLFRGRWGRYGRRIGVRIEERLLPAADTLAPMAAEEKREAGDDER